MDQAYVLYVDHQGHPAPLTECFHATASRRLASAVDRHPPSTVTEVDSAFCPTCLSFHDANTASKLGFCPRPNCKLCPLCTSVAPIAVLPDEQLVGYKCGLCSWTSKDCNLTVPHSGSLESAAEQLSAALTERQKQGESLAHEHFNNLLETWEGIVKESTVNRRTTRGLATTVAKEEWSVDALEESMQLKREKAAAVTIVGGKPVERLTNLEQDPATESSTLNDIPSISIAMQALCSLSTPTSMEDVLPLPTPLRARKSRRCRAELAEGRPGILVKPKLNPLEGDSSLRTGHGQWWKKDSSAIHVMPKVKVERHGSDGPRHAFLFKIANPTLGTLRFRFASSTYKGEHVWGDDTKTTPFLENLLLDTLSQTHANVTLVSSLDGMPSSDMVELESAEDSFLELGKAATEVPEAVANWTVEKAASALSDVEVVVRPIAHNKAVSWFECVLMDLSDAVEPSFRGLPLALQIEVGNGSWESSLVKPEDEVDGKPDLVTFDLLVVWQPSRS